MKLGLKPLSEQQELVMRLRKEEGMTCRQIAEGLGVSAGRVQQIYAEARRRLEEHEENPRESLVLLPARVRKLLEYLEFQCRSELLEAVQSGRIYFDEKEPWRAISDSQKAGKTGRNVAKWRNMGRHTWEILLQWLGLQTAEEQEAEKRKRKEEAAKKREVREVEERRRAAEWRARMKGRLESWNGGD